MFGLDGDTKDTFDATVDKLIEYKAPLSFMFILSPRVGLKIRDELMAQGRIDHSDWDRYHSYECVFEPKNMTRQELEDGLLAGPAPVLLARLDRPPAAPPAQPPHAPVARPEPVLPLGGQPGDSSADVLLTGRDWRSPSGKA